MQQNRKRETIHKRQDNRMTLLNQLSLTNKRGTSYRCKFKYKYNRVRTTIQEHIDIIGNFITNNYLNQKQLPSLKNQFLDRGSKLAKNQVNKNKRISKFYIFNLNQEIKFLHFNYKNIIQSQLFLQSHILLRKIQSIDNTYSSVPSAFFNLQLKFSIPKRMVDSLHGKLGTQPLPGCIITAVGPFYAELISKEYDNIELLASYQRMQNNIEEIVGWKQLGSKNQHLLVLLLVYKLRLIQLSHGSNRRLGQTLNQLYEVIMLNGCEQLLWVYFVWSGRIQQNYLAMISAYCKLCIYSWVYQIPDIELYAYQNISYCYYYLNQNEKSQFFMYKYQMNLIQQQSIYTQGLINKFILQLNNYQYTDLIRNNNYWYLSIEELRGYNKYHNMKIQINNPKIQSMNKNIKFIRSSLKSVINHCNIKYINAKTLLTRVSRSKDHQFNSKIKSPIILSHRSPLKDLKVFHHLKSINKQYNREQFYTMYNGRRSMNVLKGMFILIMLQIDALL